MPASLPAKYYLTHARELFAYISTHCEGLLEEPHRQYLRSFQQLSPSGQCMLVRILARKPQFLQRESLYYEEIDDPESALRELFALNFASAVRAGEWPEFTLHLTKSQILTCFANTPLKVRRSSSKAELVSLASSYFTGKETNLFYIRDSWVVRRQQDIVDYLLFLFFGDLRNRFTKFVLRDLGVMKTRQPAKNISARFNSLQDANSAFYLSKLRRDYLNNPGETRDHAVSYIHQNKPIGDAALRVWDKLVLGVGNDLVAEDPDLATSLWRRSNHPKAFEQRIRTAYTHGDRGELASELQSLMKQNIDATSKIFVRDFYTRKYEGKKTSVYTDMLREATQHLGIDESYLGSVEEGVIRYYRRQNQQAWFVENKLWNVLFAFTLWPLLFGEERAQYTEFDYLPAPLRDKKFYNENQHAIEQQLEILNRPQEALKLFTRIAAREYGTPTGLFRWSSNILNYLSPCVLLAPENSLALQVREMALDYSNCCSGYPDLMVVAQNRLRFEEVKAPGDSLRPNQLLSIERLRNVGLSVDICQVEWMTDPDQVYAVVDIETTGGRKTGNAITEIAVVKVKNGVLFDEWTSLINPGQAIPTHITRLTGINNQMVAQAPRFADIADELERELDQAIFVAHNVGFDYGFIKAAFEAIGRSFRKPKFCTVQNTRKTFPGLKSYSLGNLAVEFDLDLVNAHRALSDARATADLLRLIQEKRRTCNTHG